MQTQLTSAACPLAELLMGMVQRRAEEITKDSPIESLQVILVNGNAYNQQLWI